MTRLRAGRLTDEQWQRQLAFPNAGAVIEKVERSARHSEEAQQRLLMSILIMNSCKERGRQWRGPHCCCTHTHTLHMLAATGTRRRTCMNVHEHTLTQGEGGGGERGGEATHLKHPAAEP